jgi:hypothetical protein
MVHAVGMRGALLVSGSIAASAWGCGLSGTTIPDETWTCQWDAQEARPLAIPATPSGEAGALPASDCQQTCGPPVSDCTYTVLDGGQPGAVCPVCTF